MAKKEEEDRKLAQEEEAEPNKDKEEPEAVEDDAA